MQYDGVVKWYDPNKAFGFISGGPDGDAFIHRTNLDPGRDELIEGQEVRFSVRPGSRGPEAYNVTVTKESNNPPRLRTPRDSGGGRPPFQSGRPGGARTRTPARIPAHLPQGPVTCSVVSIDQSERFMFVRAERDDFEVYVHGSLMQELRHRPRLGDRVRVIVGEGPRGLRANSLESAE